MYNSLQVSNYDMFQHLGAILRGYSKLPEDDTPVPLRMAPGCHPQGLFKTSWGWHPGAETCSSL